MKRGKKQQTVSFDSVLVVRAWEYAIINNEKQINRLQTTLGNGEGEIKKRVPELIVLFTRVLCREE